MQVGRLAFAVVRKSISSKLGGALESKLLLVDFAVQA